MLFRYSLFFVAIYYFIIFMYHTYHVLMDILSDFKVFRFLFPHCFSVMLFLRHLLILSFRKFMKFIFLLEVKMGLSSSNLRGSAA